MMNNNISPAQQDKFALLANIPKELQSLNQWVVWRYEDVGSDKPTKVPYCSLTGTTASTTNPSTWSSFSTAIEIYKRDNYDGIGFVFSKDDPYTFIDLDNTNGNQIALDRQLKIYHEFDSYSELSPSGLGLHIIVKGKISSGRKRSFIEVYSSGRYATFTGNLYNNKPITENQNKLIQLWEQMGASVPQTFIYDGNDIEKENDNEILHKASVAANGQKFIKLFQGQWSDFYTSQSEADFAIIDIIAFYTQNRNQIERIFHTSELGKRLKARRKDYLAWMINKSFDRMLPQIDFDGFSNVIEFAKANAGSANGKPAVFDTANTSSTLVPATNQSQTKIKLPPGLLGELASFIYQSSPRPVPEIALAAAIGLMSGISGRAYNVSGTGLNQYVLLLASTGSGKEAMQAGISKLINIIKQQVPTAINFIGPSEIASGQALFKYISNNSQCFVSVLGEFGLRLMQMANTNANSAEVSLRRMLLDFYNKSGYRDVAQPSIYADKDKNSGAIQSPAFSILGESTPERFYNCLNEDMISEGLLPRFLLIEYEGQRVAFNEKHGEIQPSFSLIERLTTLAANAETIQHANNPRRVINVMFTDAAKVLANNYDKYCDKQINNSQKDVVKQLWNRAHIKTLKLAAVIAVGVNMYDPLIEIDHLEWAIAMVNNDINTLSIKFDKGEIGTNTQENRQLDEITRMIKDYLFKEWDDVKKYCPDVKIQNMHHNKIISYAYLSRRLLANGAFKNDRVGATLALRRCIQTMMERDYLREVGKSELASKFGTTQRAFILSNINILN